MNDLKIPTPSPSVDLEATLAEAKLHWPRKQLPPLTEREVDALKSGAKVIPLTRGKWAIVDAKDYGQMTTNSWTARFDGHNFYAFRKLYINGGSIEIGMHRAIFQTSMPRIDHKNGDGLDNRCKNLRPCTPSQNGANSQMKKANFSGYKGVDWQPKHGRFRARIKINYKSIYLGLFSTAEEAHQSYKAASLKYFGEFANPGFSQTIR